MRTSVGHGMGYGRGQGRTGGKVEVMLHKTRQDRTRQGRVGYSVFN